MMQERYEQQLRKQEALLNRKNEKTDFYNGIYDRWKYPVLTREHVPLYWRYDLNPETNPYFMERLGINAVFNAGAIELDGKICLVARVEGSDRKSFFAVAESTTGVDQFVFREKPVQLPDCDPNETNVYDMRLTKHEDGWIYGVFCSESSANDPKDLSAAVAQAGIVRTKDLNTWERLPNLITKQSPQQRNVCLLPKYSNPLAKNGSGATPIATEKGWLHIAHGVRNTAAGLRYVIYVFVTDLEDPSRVIAEPSGYLIAPFGAERVGDVSNVVFTNGAVVREDGTVYIYYASADTRLHVATSTIDQLLDYAFHTPTDPLRSVDCVKQRCELIDRNLAFLQKEQGK